MTPTTEDILNLLKKWNVKIFSCVEDEKNNVITISAEPVIIYHLIQKNEVKVLFHVGVRPHDAAQIVLDLNKLDNIKNVESPDLFVFIDDTKNIIVGPEAMNLFDGFIKDNIINEFVENQKQLRMLMTAENLPSC